MEQEIPEGSVLNQLRLYFNTLQQTGNSYLFVTDMKTGTVLLSDNFVEDFDLPGIVLEDMDKYWLPIIYEGDRNRYTASLKAVFETHVTDEHNLEYRVQYRNGEFGWVNCRGKLARDEDGTPVFWAGVIIKMDQRLRADSITGLLNRYAMNKTLKDELEASAGCHGAVVIIGLDNFHVIKETYGQHFGDVVLKQIAQNIMNVLPPDILLYKLDGDHFGFLWPDAMPDEMEIIFSSIQLCMREVRDAEDTLYCTASAGAAFYPVDGTESVTLMKYAEAALDMARRQGKDRICFFSKENYDRWRYDVGMQNLMQNCIAKGCEDFMLYYQPQVDAKDGRLIGAEALLRWRDKDETIVAPMQFIPFLEKSRMIIPVGHWIIEQAFATCKEWQKYQPDFLMSINISLYQLEEHMFFPFVEDCVARYELDPHTIIFELTESQSVTDWDFVNQQFQKFHSLGIQIAMDDFGTGYASLGYLKNFACNIVKVDRVFIIDIMRDEYDRNLVKYVIMLCHSIGMKVCIEGVEEKEAYEYLRDECDADLIQGFYFGRPEPKDVFLQRFGAK